MKEQALERLVERIDQLDHATLVPLVRKFYNQNNIFDNVIDLTSAGIVVINRMRRVLLANGAVEEMLTIHNLRNVVLSKCAPELSQ
jgi:hypothetical protein